MMKRKRILGVLTALVTVFAAVAGFASCGKKAKYTVGICQLAQHEALDAATEGFKAALTEALGDEVEFIVRNASGDPAVCSTIAGTFVTKKVDLILANATAPLQATAQATKEIPILGTSVTDYATALGLTSWNGTVGGNISGTSDLAPLPEQAKMIRELVPGAKKVGLLYCSAEPNSEYQIQEIEKELASLGLESRRFSFTDSNDISSVATNACAYADVIYIPTDNTAANNTEAIANVVIPAKKPVIAGEAGICRGCGIATLSIDYYKLGYETGKMAAEILKGTAKVGDMAIRYADRTERLYNAKNCQALGLTPPEGYSPLAD